MKITIECACGNTVNIPALDQKTTMVRDYLEGGHFRLIKAENKEIQIWCKKMQKMDCFEIRLNRCQNRQFS